MSYKKKEDGNLVNEITLGDGYPLSVHFQPLKVGGETSPIEVSSANHDNSVNGKVKIIGDLEVTGSVRINYGESGLASDLNSKIDKVGIWTDSGNLIFSDGDALFYIIGDEGIDTEYDASSGYIKIKGEDASDSNKGIASFSSDDFTVSSGAVTKKAKQAFASEFAGRYTVATNSRFSGGFPNYHLKTATIATVSGTGDTAVNVDTLKYSLMMPEAGNVTAFSADLEWDTADGEIYVDLWKFGVMSNTGSGLTSVACDHISRLTFTDPSDTTYYKEKADGSLDGTAADFAAGESLCVTMQGDSNSDGQYVYCRPVVTVVYDS